MKIQAKLLSLAVCLVALGGFSSLVAQTPENRRDVPAPVAPVPQSQTTTSNTAFPPVQNPNEVLTFEIVNLRKSLQALSKRLGEMSEKFVVPSKENGAARNNSNKILLNLEILNRAEQRAEVLRRQLIELVEKETQIKSRSVLIEEDMRPENVERSLNTAGSTRAPELRDARRRVLENERDNLRSLLNQIQQSRARLETDVQQADLLVTRLRQKVLPIIEGEIQTLDVKQP